MRRKAVFGLAAISLLARCGGHVEEARGDHPALPDAGLDVQAPGSDAGAPTPLDAGPPMCVPGMSVACTCTNGAAGAQLCQDDRKYGACVCQGVDAGVTTCFPGESSGCSCDNGATGAQVCRADGSYAPCICDSDGGSWEQQQLAWLKAGIVGTWTGTVKNPWQPAFQATLVFEASGHYSGHCPGDSSVVFYYGTNDDAPEKTYDIIDVKTNGEGWGEVIIYFGPGSTNVDDLRHVALSSDQNRLSFESWHQDSYGPIAFTLTRQK